MAKLRIVVLGCIVRCPLAGRAWSDLNYLLGLRELGHEAIFIEQLEPGEPCYDPTRNVMALETAYGLAYAERAFREVGLEQAWAFFDGGAKRWLGPLSARAAAIAADSDLVLNLGGSSSIEPFFGNCPVRVLVDMDPGFTQARHRTFALTREQAAAHNAFLSYGDHTRGDLPGDGFPWKTTRPPVCLRWWPRSEPAGSALTTIMRWKSYQPIAIDGRELGLKDQSFERVIDLPSRVDTALEVAILAGDHVREHLHRAGWRTVDALDISRDLMSYRSYIQGSLGEFSVAKQGYVVTRSGWFSERSACYLATGRPVVTEDTGFQAGQPFDGGILSFRDVTEAAAAIAELRGRYAEHCRAAREIAEEVFDARRVLPTLLETAIDAAG